ncbi:hypothetical protein LJD47_33055, partial [Escherichia coli]|nr:hypothetical protein [Escherichia coli]
VGVSAGKRTNCVAGQAGDAALSTGGALGFQSAGCTIGDVASVHADLTGALGTAVTELLTRRAVIGVGVAIVAKDIASEKGIALAAAVDDRDVRRDIPVHQPAQQRAAAIRLVS